MSTMDDTNDKPEAPATPPPPGKRKRGRPTKFTPERVERILQAIRAGAYLNAAAAYGGVRPTTLYHWWREGRTQERGKLREFSDSLEKALADAELSAIMVINQAKKDGDWKAALAFLERRFPQRWGKRDRHTIEGTGTGGAVKHEHTSLTLKVVPANLTDRDGNVTGSDALDLTAAAATAVVTESAVRSGVSIENQETLDPMADVDVDIDAEINGRD